MGKEKISMLVIPINNPDGEWIGNVSVNTETCEVIDNLKEGYRVEGDMPPLNHLTV